MGKRMPAVNEESGDERRRAKAKRRCTARKVLSSGSADADRASERILNDGKH